MYSYDDRLRAVQLYMKLGMRAGLTIRQLGYPTKNALQGLAPGLRAAPGLAEDLHA
jgi:hypothetical protein